MWGDERRYEKGQVFLSLFFLYYISGYCNNSFTPNYKPLLPERANETVC